MATPKKNDKRISDPDDDLEQDDLTDQPGSLKDVDDDDDLDAPLDDLEYDNIEEYDDEDDDF